MYTRTYVHVRIIMTLCVAFTSTERITFKYSLKCYPVELCPPSTLTLDPPLYSTHQNTTSHKRPVRPFPFNVLRHQCAPFDARSFYRLAPVQIGAPRVGFSALLKQVCVLNDIGNISWLPTSGQLSKKKLWMPTTAAHGHSLFKTT